MSHVHLHTYTHTREGKKRQAREFSCRQVIKIPQQALATASREKLFSFRQASEREQEELGKKEANKKLFLFFIDLTSECLIIRIMRRCYINTESKYIIRRRYLLHNTVSCVLNAPLAQ